MLNKLTRASPSLADEAEDSVNTASSDGAFTVELAVGAALSKTGQKWLVDATNRVTGGRW